MKNKKGFSLFKLAARVVVIFLILLILFLLFPFYFSDLLFPVKTVSSEQPPEMGERVNLVLLGFDRDSARSKKGDDLFRPDVILTVSIDTRQGKVAMASIPRDCYVKVHGQDVYDKINHSYMYGYYGASENGDRVLAGLKTTVRTVQDFLGGVPLHGYFVVDMEGAADIIDAVGGVYIDVKEDMRSRYGQGSVQIAKGYQLLDGKKVLQYTRNRADYLGGERGRTFRQQEVLTALFKKMVSPAGLAKMPLLISAVKTNIQTDLSFAQLSALSALGLKIDRQNIISRVFGGEGRLSARRGQNIYFLVADQQNRIEIIQEVFGVSVGGLPVPELSGPLAEEPVYVPEEVIEPDFTDDLPWEEDDDLPEPENQVAESPSEEDEEFKQEEAAEPPAEPGPEPEPQEEPDETNDDYSVRIARYKKV